jgi:hypothetical protein
MAAGTRGEFNLNKLKGGDKIQVLAQGMYVYGYSRPYVDLYVEPKVDCGPNDFEDILKEFEFLDHPEPGTDKSVLTYYVTEFNHEAKMKLYCLVSFGYFI